MARGPGADEVGRVSIRVLPDTSRFRRELERDLKAIQQSLEVEIPVTVDSTAALAKIKRLERELSKLGDVNVRANVQSVGTIGDVGDVDEKFQRVDRSTNNIRRNSTVIRRNFSRLSGILTRGIVAPIGNMTRQLVTLNRIRAIVLGITLAIPALLGPIAGLLAGLPSLLFAFGAAGAAIALGFDGIKDAFSGLKDEVQDLKKAVSDTFRQTLTPQAKELEKIFPILERGLSFVAQGLSEMFAGFVDALTSARGMQNMNIILARTGKLFADLRPFMYDFTAGLLQIGRIGAENFGYLSDTMNAFGENFREMVDSMDRTGALDRAFRGLAKVTDGLLTALLLIFEAGVIMLDVIGEPLQEALIALGRMFVDLAPILSQISGLFLDIVTDALPIFTDLFRAIGPGLVSVFQALGQAIKVAAPGMQALAEGFSKFLKGAAPALVSIGELVTAIGPTLGQALADLGPIVARVIGALTDALGTALPKLIPAMVNFASALADLFVALAPILDPLAELASILLDSLAVAFREIAPIVKDFAQEFSSILGPVLPELSRAFKGLASAIGPIIKPLLEGLIDILRQLIPLLPDLIDLFTLMTYPLRIIAWAVSGLMTVLGGLISIVGDVSRAVGGFVSTAGKFGVRFTEYMLNGFQEPVRTFEDTAIKSLGKIRDRFEETTTESGKAIAKLSGTLVNSETIFDKIVARNEERSGRWLEVMRSNNEGVATSWREALGIVSASTDEFSGQITKSQSVFSQMARQNAIDAAIWRQRMSQAATGTSTTWRNSLGQIVAGMRNTTGEAGKQGAAAGLAYVKGMRAGEGASRVAAARLVQGVRDVLGKGAADAVRSGAAIANGFASGIGSPTARVRAAAAAAALMRSIARLFPSSPAQEGPFSGSGWTVNRGVALVDGFAQGIRTQAGVAAKAGEFMMRSLDSALVSAAPDVNEIVDAGAGLVSLRNLSAGAPRASSASSASDGIADAVERALSGWAVVTDPQGITRLVNRTNQQNARR